MVMNFMQEPRTLGELVTIKNTKGLSLDGICYRRQRNRITIVHIHGSFGNFYQNEFVRFMAKKYAHAGVNLLSLNMASHDGLSEGYRDQSEFEYVGGAVADFSECVADIQGAVQYAVQFSDRVI